MKASITTAIAILGLAVTLCGCSKSMDEAAAEPPPIHFRLICPVAADAKGVACESDDRGAVFEEWLQSGAAEIAGSTLAVTGIDPAARSRPRNFFAACVPDAWGKDALRQKSYFIARVRAAASSNSLTDPMPKDCSPPEVSPAGANDPPGPGAAATNRIVLSGFDSSSEFAPIDPEMVRSLPLPPQQVPLHMAVVCDRSDSTPGLPCTTAELMGALDKWLGDSLGTSGASFAVFVLGSDFATTRQQFSITVKDQDHRSIAEEIAFAIRARSGLSRMLTDKVEHKSPIAEGMCQAACFLRQRSGRHALVILSDLLQVSEKWNFESKIPPSRDFIKWLEVRNYLPYLSGGSVMACPLPLPGTQLQAVWQSVFHTMGVQNIEIDPSCDTALPLKA